VKREYLEDLGTEEKIMLKCSLHRVIKKSHDDYNTESYK
jgi:hypothetical protein